MIVAVPLADKIPVVMVNVAVLPPAATVTLAGTVAYALLLDSPTTAPAVGAGPFRVAVPMVELPPLTVDGLMVRELSEGALTVKVAVLVTVP